jgi:hypothetical protein
MDRRTEFLVALQIDIRILQSELRASRALLANERVQLFRELVDALMLRGVIRRKQRDALVVQTAMVSRVEPQM